MRKLYDYLICIKNNLMFERTKYLYKKAQKAYSKIRYGQAYYVPRMIDFNQVLRSDGKLHNWGGEIL